jgi:replicative DNA helicase
MEQNKIPPNNFEAEQAVLSAALFDAEAMSYIYENVQSEDFYWPASKSVFEAMAELFAENVALDYITLKSRLDAKGVKFGDEYFLSSLIDNPAASANIKHYVKIVRDLSVLRKLINAARNIERSGFDAKENVEQILESAEKAIFNISQNKNSDSFSAISDVLLKSIGRIEKIYLSKAKITGIETGFADFDRKTAGLQPSDLILIAARPSMGKTAFALNIAQCAAVRNKIPTALFSLEMSEEQLAARLLSSEALVDSQKMRTGALEYEDWAKIAEASGRLGSAPIYIDDTPGISAVELRAKCRRLKIEKGLGLVVVDYLQLMSGNPRKIESRQQEITEISRSLKAIAREVDAPLVALSQLSRACEQRADHRPMLSDLRESGSIEQDADVVAFLYRDEYYNPETDRKNQAELIIAKQRNGPTGTVELMWRGEFTKFENLEYSHSHFPR